MKIFIRSIFLLSSILLVSCEPQCDGVFFGEPEFDECVANYSFSLKKSREIMNSHLKKNGLKFRSFPYDVVYAHKGGYLFVEGEFKLHISLEGYFVDDGGEVSWLDLNRAIDIKDYKGNREWRR